MFEHGNPIRSSELEARLEVAEANLRNATSRSNELLKRVRMVELALYASAQPRIINVAPGRTYLPLIPLSGVEQIGPCVVTLRSEQKPVLSLLSVPANNSGTGLQSETTGRQVPANSVWSVDTGVVSVGESILLEEGAVWARLSPDRESSFGVQMSPAILTHYNEVFIPVISGEISIAHSTSQGIRTLVTRLTKSTVLRFDKLQEITGDIQITSHSHVAHNAGYIHTLGGLVFRNSLWSPSGTARAQITATEDGTLSISDCKLDDINVMFTTKKNNTTQVSGAIPVNTGDIIDIDVVIPWNTSSSQISFIAQYV